MAQQQFQPRARGFTLIELMITVAIVGILMAVAIPAYSNYVLRARTTESFSVMGGFQPAAEQFWANNRTYEALPPPGNTPNFDYSTVNLTASSYTLKATGKDKMLGLIYTIDQNGTRKTTAVPSTPPFTGWVTNDTCWTDRKGGLCTQ
jgi:type IV pilus assembly protein PilE